jgi:O-antigen/teichoic acid export membrane protein
MVAFANSGFVSLWVGAEHYAGQWFTVAVISAGLGGMAIRFLQHVVFSMGEMKQASKLWTAESLLKALGLVLLVPQLGMFGVPAATALSAIVVLPAVISLARRTLGVAEVQGLLKLSKKGWRLVAVIAFAAVLSPLAVGQSWWEWLIAAMGAGLVVVCSVLALLPDLRREGVAFSRKLFMWLEPN